MADTFVVAGLKKFVSIKSRDPFSLAPLLSTLSLLVFDEAHQAVAPTYKNLVNYLIGENHDVALLGLTATPGRTPDNDVEDSELADFFNTNRVTIEIPGYKNAIDYLTSEGYLANTNYIDVKFEADHALVVTNDDEDDFSPDFLKLLGGNIARNGELIRAAKALAARHKRILLFAPSVGSARQVSLVLRALGIDAYSLDWTNSELSRKTMVDKFRGNSAGVQILCNFGVLTTGFDAPRTSCVIIGRPTRSVVLYSQMVGRAIRGSKVGGNDQADIVTVVDTSIRGFGSVADGFNFWNNKWWD
jgi:superfamily II DNA or RNA helicase